MKENHYAWIHSIRAKKPRMKNYLEEIAAACAFFEKELIYCSDFGAETWSKDYHSDMLVRGDGYFADLQKTLDTTTKSILRAQYHFIFPHRTRLVHYELEKKEFYERASSQTNISLETSIIEEAFRVHKATKMRSHQTSIKDSYFPWKRFYTRHYIFEGPMEQILTIRERLKAQINSSSTSKLCNEKIHLL